MADGPTIRTLGRRPFGASTGFQQAFLQGMQIGSQAAREQSERESKRIEQLGESAAFEEIPTAKVPRRFLGQPDVSQLPVGAEVVGRRVFAPTGQKTTEELNRQLLQAQTDILSGITRTPETDEATFARFGIPEEEREEFTLEPTTVTVKGIQVPGKRVPKRRKEIAEVVKQRLAIQSVEKLISQLENMLDKIPSQEGFQARLQGTRLVMESATGTNPQAAAFERLRMAVLGQLARVVSGERGRLTDQDIERIRNAVPSLLSTTEERRLSFEAMRAILGESKRIFGFKEKPTDLPSIENLGLDPNLFEIIEEVK